MGVCVSIVSHGHGEMVWSLIDQLLVLPEVSRVILTLNIPEPVRELSDTRLILIKNAAPKGFGANHNAAFESCGSDYFCVLNPDVELTQNPFPALVACLKNDEVGLCAPLVLDAHGHVEDSARRFITPWLLFLRKTKLATGSYKISAGIGPVYPDWVAGMFMLFKTEAYRQVGGFDPAYFMYCEDADICTRLWLRESKVMLDTSVSVIHEAQRASRINWRHLRWHLASMARYFVRYWGRLPRADGSL